MKQTLFQLLLVFCIGFAAQAQSGSQTALISAKYIDGTLTTRYGYYNMQSKVFTTCGGTKITISDENSVSPHPNPCKYNPQKPPVVDSVGVNGSAIMKRRLSKAYSSHRIN